VPVRGQIYSPKKNYPPGSPQWHRLLVLSPSGLMSSGGSSLFVMTAVIRSHHSGVRLVPGHSIPVPAGLVAALPLASVVETHQLFALPVSELAGRPDGQLPRDLVEAALAGARRLFT